MQAHTIAPQDRAQLALLMRMLRREDAEQVEAQLEEAEGTFEARERTLEITIEREVSIDFEFEVVQLSGRRPPEPPQPPEPERKDPLVLDLDGDGVELTTARGGRRFDIDGDGRDEQTAFVTGGDAFLALDRDGDGRITSGNELFGDNRGAADGFADLRRLDGNADGVIDARDERFGDLRLYDGARTRTLAEGGVDAIGLDATYAHRERADGNAEVAEATFRRSDGTLGRVADVLLAYQRFV